MGKIKGLILGFVKNLKQTISLFPVTMLCIMLATLIEAIIIDVDWDIRNITIVSTAIILTGFGSFCSESLFKTRWKAFLGVGISVLISVFLAAAYNWRGKTFLLWSNDFLAYKLPIIIGAYIFITFMIGLYGNYKISKKTFPRYTLEVFLNVLTRGIMFVILLIGVEILASIFCFLILNDTHYSLLARVFVLLFGLFFVTGIVAACINMGREISKFEKTLVKWIFLPLVVIAFVIIYIYMIKILVLWEIPSNQIFSILTALFVVGCPIWTMNEAVSENDVTMKIVRLLPYFFIPFIFLQIYSVGVRIFSYGITASRYMGIAFILLEIIYLVLCRFKQEKRGIILLIMSGFCFVACIIPYVNMQKVSQLSQEGILRKYLANADNLTDEESMALGGAYKYLKYDIPPGERKAINQLTQDQIALCNQVNDVDWRDENDGYDFYIDSGDESNVPVNVEGYKTIEPVSLSFFPEDESNTIDLTNLVITNDYGKEILHLDVSNLVENALKTEGDALGYYESDMEEANEYMNKHRMIVIDEQTSFYFVQFNLSGNWNDGEITYTYLYLEGYCLRK